MTEKKVRRALTIADALEFTRFMCTAEYYDTVREALVTSQDGTVDEYDVERLISEHGERALHAFLTDGHEAEPPLKRRHVEERSPSPTHSSTTENEDDLFFDKYAQRNLDAEEGRARRCTTLLLPKEPITDEDMKREIITIRYSETEWPVMRIMIENYVYVTYFVNECTGKRYKFNLLDIAAHCLPYGIQHSKNKFAKNDIRYWHGGSHLMFASSVLVETGSTSPAVAAKLLEHTMNIYRHDCGLHHIQVRERKCQNVVLTATLNFAVCLNLLQDRNPEFVIYDKKTFAGAIVKIADMRAKRHSHDYGDDAFISYDDCDDGLYECHAPPPAKREKEKEAEPRVKLEGEVIVEEEAEDELEFLPKTPGQQKVTALIFPQGQVICVGSNSRTSAIKALATLFEVLYNCRSDEVNLKIERALISKRKKVRPKTPAAAAEVVPPSSPTRDGTLPQKKVEDVEVIPLF